MARPLTITAYGNAQVDTAQSKSGGGSLLLAGTDDYLEVDNSSSDLNITGAWTVEAWIRLPNSNLDHYFYTSATASTTNWIFSINFDSPGSAAVLFSTNDGLGGTGSCDLTSTTLTHSQFVHYAWTANGSGRLRLYINGVQAKQTTGNAYTDLSTTNAVKIGDWAQTGVWGFDGHIDEFRVSDVERYTSTFTPASRHQPDNNTRLLIHFDGTDGSTTFTDDVGVQGSSNLTASASLTATPTDNPSMVFLGNDAYTWDSTDTWDLITGIDSGGQDQWRAAEIISATFTQSAVGGFLISAEASLSTATSQVCVAGVLIDGISSLALDTDFTISVDVFRNGSSDFTVNTDITAQADMFRGGRADLDTEFDSQSTATLTLAGASDLSVVTEFEAIGRILKLANIDLDNFATLDATAQVDIQAQSQLSLQFDQETRAGLILEPNEAYDYTWDTITADRWDHFLLDRWEPRGVILISETELNVSVGAITEAEATLSASASLTTDSLVARGGTASLQVSTAIDCDSNMFRGADCVLDSVFALECQALNLVPGSAELDTETAQTATGSVTIDGGTSLSSQTLLEASGAFLRSGSSGLDFTVQQETLARLIAGGSASLDFVSFVISEGLSRTPVLGQASLESQFNLTVTADNFAIASTALFDEIALTADANMFRGGRAELEMQGFALTTGTRVALGQALLNIEFTSDFNGDLRLLASDFVYKILEESRNIDIASETRIQGIYADSRVVSVSSETRDYRVLQESREIAIEDFT